jgi:tetratricopeptide (TPR) repeat protein
MKPSRQVTVAASLLLLISMAGSVLLLRSLDRVRGGAPLQEVLYFSSPQALKRLSLGYMGLMADIYWTRTVQHYGSNLHAATGRYDLLAPLLEITTALDPHLLIAYEYGASFLAAPPPVGAGMPSKAVELIEFGIRNNPEEWHLYHELGTVYYMDLKDYRAAADAFERGSRVPHAHPFLKILAGSMAAHAGDYQMALMMWTTTYESSTDENIRANAAAHIRAIRADQDITKLDEIIAQYEHKTGHPPRSFSDLIATGFLSGVPVDPLGQPYKLMPDGRSEVRNPDDFPFILKGTPRGYTPPAKPRL